MTTFAAKDEVLELLKGGEWELGYGDSSRGDGRYWLQRGGLSKGGETKSVKSSTVAALERRGLIKVAPRASKQPFWLRRYQLTTAPPATPPERE